MYLAILNKNWLQKLDITEDLRIWINKDESFFISLSYQ